MSKSGASNKSRGFNQRLRDAAARGESLIRQGPERFDPDRASDLSRSSRFEARHCVIVVVVAKRTI